MGRMAVPRVPPEPKIPRGTGEKAEEAARARRRRVAASFGMAGTYDRVSRRLGRTRSSGAAAKIVAIDPYEWWRIAVPLAMFLVGGVTLIGASLSGSAVGIAAGIVMAGMGPVGVLQALMHQPQRPSLSERFPDIHDLQAPPSPYDAQRERAMQGDSPFPMPRMTGEGFYPQDALRPERVMPGDEFPLPSTDDMRKMAGMTPHGSEEEIWAALGHGGRPRPTVSQPGRMSAGDDVGLAQRLDEMGQHELANMVRNRRRGREHLK